jgi:hypothetical protein
MMRISAKNVCEGVGGARQLASLTAFSERLRQTPPQSILTTFHQQGGQGNTNTCHDSSISAYCLKYPFKLNHLQGIKGHLLSQLYKAI